jgi:TPR repeat protein
MYNLGLGVSENDKTAVKWHTLAADQGYADAQSNLGVKYHYGKGVLTKNRRAYMW